MKMRHLYFFNYLKSLRCNAGKVFSLSVAWYLILLWLSSSMMMSCARMGSPDGGWYDETPPKVVSTSPKEGSVHVTDKKIYIQFDEFIKIDNPTEKVVISPPQIESPEIKSQGKRIVVELKDSLKPDLTYTVDFSDAISDNNEGNPLGNYTYSFSTGSKIDTMEVSGYVLEAENLEPIKGILVGLYANHSDSIFRHKPMLRVSRTDSRGKFTIRGIAPGTYRIYALQDVDGNYFYNQKSEKLAFTHDLITPSSKPDIRQDTIWADSLHIKNILQVNYTHFLPDDITLRAFTEIQTNRYLIKTERKEPNFFSLFFSYGSDQLPQIKGLNFNDKDAFIMESTPRGDTLTYWLRDTTLIHQDTLEVQLSYQATDSLGHLHQQVDTVSLLSKIPYAKRLKLEQKKIDEWTKKQEKAKKRGEPYDSIMPKENLDVQVTVGSTMTADKNVSFHFETPLAKIDTSKIHLYAKHDTLWYVSPYEFEQQRDTTVKALNKAYLEHTRDYVLRGEWRPGIEYSLELDSAAFIDIYGVASTKKKQGFSVQSNNELSTILLTIAGAKQAPMVVQLLDTSDKPVKQAPVVNGEAQFFYVKPGDYYARLFVDTNGNGRWDTGNYDENRQPEEVYYYPKKITCRAKWDFNETWNLTQTPLYQQKPAQITKQKGEQQRKIQNRNAKRALDLGKKYVPGMLK